MSSYMLVSDRPLENYEKFMVECLENMRGQPVRYVGLVVGMEDEVVMTAYHNANVADMQMAAAQIQADITLEIVRVNLPSLTGESEEDAWDEDEDEDY